MLLTHPFWATFTQRAICRAEDCAEMILALTCDDREQVDALFEKAMSAGATPEGPIRDEGWMYERYFLDLDGHIWDLFWMADPHEAEG